MGLQYYLAIILETERNLNSRNFYFLVIAIKVERSHALLEEFIDSMEFVTHNLNLPQPKLSLADTAGL